MLLRSEADYQVDILIKKLQSSHEVTETLRRPDTNIYNARAHCDIVHEDYLSLSDRLDIDDHTIQNSDYESELLEIQESHEEDSTTL